MNGGAANPEESFARSVVTGKPIANNSRGFRDRRCDYPGGEGGYDYTALDRIMPHPVYGKMYWICVLNPSAKTFETVRGLLAEAFEAGLRQRARRAGPDVAPDRRGT